MTTVKIRIQPTIGLIAVVALWSLVAVAGARAYVLQGPHVLELMIDHLGKAQRLLVEQRQVIHGVGESEQNVEVAETLRYQFPGGFRSDITSGDLKRIHVEAQGRRLTAMDGRVTMGDDRLADVYKDLMLFRSRSVLVHRLATLGVAVRVSSYGLLEDQVAYVVGAQYPDESVPQVWVDKETFRPLRWIVRPAEVPGQPPRLEIRYGRWARHGKLWYPQQIDMLESGNLSRSIQAVSVTVNPTFAPQTFDIAHLQNTLRSEPADDAQGEPPDRLKEVRETIEEFKKLYE